MTGIVMKLVQAKKFGFIKGEDGTDYFFHRDDFNGFYDDLSHDVDAGMKIRVTFDVKQSPKGARAGNVARVDGGVPIPSREDRE